MEIVFGILGIAMAFSFLGKLLSSTFNNFKILIGIQRSYIRLEYADEYAASTTAIEIVSIFAAMFILISYLDVGYAYTNLIKTLLFIFGVIILLILLSSIHWALGVLVTSRFSLAERKEVYSDLLLHGFAGQIARIKIGHIFIANLLIMLSILSVVLFVVYKIFTIILFPIILWLLTP